MYFGLTRFRIAENDEYAFFCSIMFDFNGVFCVADCPFCFLKSCIYGLKIRNVLDSYVNTWHNHKTEFRSTYIQMGKNSTVFHIN